MTISNIGKKGKYRLEEHAHEEMPQDICIGVNPTILWSMGNKSKKIRKIYTLFLEAQVHQPNENNTAKRDFKQTFLMI